MVKKRYNFLLKKVIDIQVSLIDTISYTICRIQKVGWGFRSSGEERKKLKNLAHYNTNEKRIQYNFKKVANKIF
jgi:hypothetical protein